MTADFLDAVRNGELKDQPKRFPFGDKPHQTLPPEWVEPFLRYVYAHNVNLFGKAILAAMDAEPTDRRYKGRANG